MTVPRIGWRDLRDQAPTDATILVVDDEKTIRESLDRILTRLGYQVKKAASAEEADQWIGSQPFDLVLLDIELPRMKGVEFLGWILNREPDLPVIMLTGLDDPDLAIECLEEGARNYLVKPIDAEFLRLAVSDALAVSELLSQRNRDRTD